MSISTHPRIRTTVSINWIGANKLHIVDDGARHISDPPFGSNIVTRTKMYVFDRELPTCPNVQLDSRRSQVVSIHRQQPIDLFETHKQ